MRMNLDLTSSELQWLVTQSRVKGDKIEANYFEILRKIVAKAKHRVIAEGNINTPEKSKTRDRTWSIQRCCRFYYHKTTADHKNICGRNGKIIP